jgi:ketosteroid isomerase-like protein
MLSSFKTLSRWAGAAVLVLAAAVSAGAGLVRQNAAAGIQSVADPEIRKSLQRLNEVLATRSLETAMTVFDDADDIMVIGSDTGEIFVGRERVRFFVKALVDMPFVFSFPMDQVTVARSGDIAWAFIDGKMVHTKSDGTASANPYRILAVLVKRADGWKWKAFSGSIPRGE